MVVSTGMTFASRRRWPCLTEDDHPGWAAVDAESASGANIVVDDEHDIVGRVISGAFSSFRLGDGVRLHHMNALPRTNIDAALTHDAFGLVNVNELLWLYRE